MEGPSEKASGGAVSYTHLDVYKRQMLWGVNQGYLDADEYLPSIRKAWKAACDAVSKEGALGWVCLLYTSWLRNGLFSSSG